MIEGGKDLRAENKALRAEVARLQAVEEALMAEVVGLRARTALGGDFTPPFSETNTSAGPYTRWRYLSADPNDVAR